MTAVRLVCITMAGSEYVLWERDEGAVFPHGDVRDGEAPADATRRIVEEWTGTKGPKLELVDMVAKPGSLLLVVRAMLTEEPKGKTRRAKRMELPARVGELDGKYVEESLKTSLNYKLTRA